MEIKEYKIKVEKEHLYPLKALFSIVDGRLATSIEDVQAIMSVWCGRKVFTHELPHILDEIKSANPVWYMQAKDLIDFIKSSRNQDGFLELMDIIDKDFSRVYIMVEVGIYNV